MEPIPGIEPGQNPYQGLILPLNHIGMFAGCFQRRIRLDTSATTRQLATNLTNTSSIPYASEFTVLQFPLGQPSA